MQQLSLDAEWRRTGLYALGAALLLAAGGCSRSQAVLPQPAQARLETSRDCPETPPEGDRPLIAVLSPHRADRLADIERKFVQGVLLGLRSDGTPGEPPPFDTYCPDDGHPDGDATAAIAREIAANPRVLAIIGSVASGATAKIDQVVRTHPTPLPVLSPSSTRTGLGNGNPWFFRLSPVDQEVLKALVDHLRAKWVTERPQQLAKAMNLACIADLGAENRVWAEGLSDDLGHVCLGDCKVVGCPVLASDGGGDRKAAYALAVEELVKLHARTELYAIGLFAQSRDAGPLARQIQDRLPGVTLFSPGNSTAEYRSAAGSAAAQNTIVGTAYASFGASTPGALGLARELGKGLEPGVLDNFLAQGYDAGRLLTAALRDVQRVAGRAFASREALRDQIERAEIKEGALGPLVFNSKRERMLQTALKRWRGSELVPVDVYDKGWSSGWPGAWFEDIAAVPLGLLLGALLAGFYQVLAIRLKHKLRPEWWGVAKSWLPQAASFLAALGFGAWFQEVLLPKGTAFWTSLPVGFLSVIAVVVLLALRVGNVAWVSPQPARMLYQRMLHSRRIRLFHYRALIDAALAALPEHEEATQKQHGSLHGPYVPLPAKLDGKLTSDPLQELLQRMPVAGPWLISLEAPGGQGKTALLRALTRELCARARTGEGPIPLLIAGPPKAALDERVRDVLGRRTLDPAFVDWQLAKGHFALVLDGLSEANISADEIRGFLRPKALSLLVSMRPSQDLSKALKSAGALRCEPQRLDDAEFERLAANYAGRGPQVSARLRAQLKGKDDRFSPLFVRFAAEQPDAEGIASVFEQVIADRVGRNTDLLARVKRYCLDTYWNDGIRIRTTNDPAERALLTDMVASGLMIQVAGPAYRFQHDSLQVYLTACAILPDRGKQWRVLERCAGERALRRRDESGSDDTDLFEMCLILERDTQPVRDWLWFRMNEWLNDRTILERLCRASLPAELRDAGVEQPRKALVHRVAELEKSSDDGSAGVRFATSSVPKLFRWMARELWKDMPESERTALKELPRQYREQRQPRENLR